MPHLPDIVEVSVGHGLLLRQLADLIEKLVQLISKQASFKTFSRLF